jgi:hypothetical protein
LTFADIIYKKDFSKSKTDEYGSRIQISFDTKYSDGVELTQIRMLDRIPGKIMRQLQFYEKAPFSLKSYYF